MGGDLGAALTPLPSTASPGFWPLLTMSATMGGTMRSPLTATFFAVELTGNTHLLLPLLAACVTAHVVTVLAMRRSILTEKVARRGHHLSREYRVDPFTLTRAQDVMTMRVETLPDSMTLHQAATLMTKPETRHPGFPVVDSDNQVLGVVDPPTLLRWRRRASTAMRRCETCCQGHGWYPRTRTNIWWADRTYDARKCRPHPDHRPRKYAARRLYRLEGPAQRTRSVASGGAGSGGAVSGALTQLARCRLIFRCRK